MPDDNGTYVYMDRYGWTAEYNDKKGSNRERIGCIMVVVVGGEAVGYVDLSICMLICVHLSVGEWSSFTESQAHICIA